MSQSTTSNFPILKVLYHHKKLNISIFLFYIIASLLIVLFVFKKQYTSVVSIIPSAASFASGGIGGQLGALSDLAGLNFGGASAQSQEMYMGIINSRKLLDSAIIKEFTIMEKGETLKKNYIGFLEIEGNSEIEIIEKALKAIREETIYIDIDTDNGILYLSVTTPFSDYSAQLANYITKRLNELVQTEVQSEYRYQLNYLKEKINEVNDSLKTVERELELFLESNTDPTTPQFQVEQIRLRRNLEIQTGIFIELRKQQEIFILENMVNLSDIKVLDSAKPSFKKSRPKRSLLLISFVLIAVFLHIGFVGGRLILKNFVANLKLN